MSEKTFVYWGYIMLEFFNQKGVAIDGRHLNVCLVDKIVLNKQLLSNVPIAKSIYNGIMVIFDFELPKNYNTPIIGLSLYENIGYAQMSYISPSRQKRVRIWVLLCENLIKLKGYSLGVYENDIYQLLFERLKLTVYIYDTNPPPSVNNYGLEVYNDKGELVFDSDYPPMKIGIKDNIDNGKHILFTNRFFVHGWTGSGQLRMVLNERECYPFFEVCYQGKIMDITQALIIAGLEKDANFNLKANYVSWFFELVENNQHLNAVIGYV